MNKFRLHRMQMSGITLGIFHKKAPWAPAWWSAALPGLGHLCMGEYFKGLILMFLELCINFQANLNRAILFTFTGRFQEATEILHVEWALVYASIFCFAIFDAYRMSVERNMLAELEKKQKKRFYQFAKYTVLGVNYLNRKNPWSAAAWSFLFSGFGHIYNMKTLKGVILMLWLTLIVCFSNLHTAIVATFLGQFEEVHTSLNYQWLMFFPSIYLFSIWDAYNDAVEMNKLFEEELKKHFTEKFGVRHLPQ